MKDRGFYRQSPPPGEFSGPKGRDEEFDDQLMDLRLRLRNWRSAAGPGRS